MFHPTCRPLAIEMTTSWLGADPRVNRDLFRVRLIRLWPWHLPLAIQRRKLKFYRLSEFCSKSKHWKSDMKKNWPFLVPTAARHGDGSTRLCAIDHWWKTLRPFRFGASDNRSVDQDRALSGSEAVYSRCGRFRDLFEALKIADKFDKKWLYRN